MKKQFVCVLFFSFVLLDTFSQSVGINYTAASANVSALLDVDAGSGTKKGILIPRIALTSATDASTITTPANSLLVYNTGTGGLSPASYYWNSGTSTSPVWVPLVSGGSSATAWMLNGNSGTTAGTDFIGTTDAVDLVFKTNGVQKMRILSNGFVGIGTSTITPSTVLVVSSDGNTGAAGSPSLIVRGDVNKERVQLESYGTSAGPIYNGVGARGTVASPSQTLANDVISGLGGRGFDNGSPSAMTGNMGLLLIKAEENFTTTAQGVYFSFNTTDTGTVTRTEKMRLTSTGYLGLGTTTPNVLFDVNGGIAVRATTNSSISTQQDNYAIGSGTTFRINPTATSHITGFSGGYDGKIVIVRNVGSYTVVFDHENASSSAANRFTLSTGANISVQVNHSIVFQYDATSQRWYDIAVR